MTRSEATRWQRNKEKQADAPPWFVLHGELVDGSVFDDQEESVVGGGGAGAARLHNCRCGMPKRQSKIYNQLSVKNVYNIITAQRNTTRCARAEEHMKSVL